uniref:NADH-ubiquinone oxidoreductase chain 3 n=1 Tax=Bactrurus brachycaudus TaxID=111554 RepID=A0A6C0X4T8_9CRUS|nr:NADH dehydrogenase subunit 3 [Bactrurus brachycaudus]QIC54385.1 NADH dehydrogenase subunit 3 [Bactrurus brachycaudus]
MSMIWNIIFLFFLISAILISGSLLLSVHSSPSSNSLSPYECGFDPSSHARIPFSLRFFMIAIIFLVFDVEVALLLPLGMMFPVTSYNTISLLGISLGVILILGLFYEWNLGSLSWA